MNWSVLAAGKVFKQAFALVVIASLVSVVLHAVESWRVLGAALSLGIFSTVTQRKTIKIRSSNKLGDSHRVRARIQEGDSNWQEVAVDLHIMDALQKAGDLSFCSFWVADAAISSQACLSEPSHLGLALRAKLISIDQCLQSTRTIMLKLYEPIVNVEIIWTALNTASRKIFEGMYQKCLWTRPPSIDFY